MPVITKVRTNATSEQIEKAISGYNHDISEEGDGVFEIYMASFDRYHLKLESANSTLEDNLKYDNPTLEFEILETYYE